MLNGVRNLRALTRSVKDDDGNVTLEPTYPPEELRKRYKEPTRSQAYIDRCILVADCALALERSYYHFVLDIDDELIHPHLIYCQDKLNKDGKEEATIESYILEIFDPTLPRYRMKKRLGDYVKFLDDEGAEKPRVRFTTMEKLKQSGLLAKEIWEQA